MKWGVRRYQNADGTLTEAGKKRRVRDSKRFERTIEKASYHENMGVGDGPMAKYHWRQVEKGVNRGEKIIKSMYKNFGKTAFNDMDDYTRYTAEIYLHNAGFIKSQVGTYQDWLKHK